MQRALNTTIEEAAFSMCFAYIHCWAKAVFYMDPHRGYISSLVCTGKDHTRVEVGSNTSTVTLRVVGGDEKVSLKSETVKYGHEYQGTQAQERLHLQGPEAYKKDRPVLSSERVHHKNKDRNCQTVINIWSWAPGWCSTPRLTDWLTVSRNVTLTLTLTKQLTVAF
jgi:hypothetical protein